MKEILQYPGIGLVVFGFILIIAGFGINDSIALAGAIMVLAGVFLIWVAVKDKEPKEGKTDATQ